MTEPTASKTSPGSSDLFDRQMAALRAEEAAPDPEALAEVLAELAEHGSDPEYYRRLTAEADRRAEQAWADLAEHEQRAERQRADLAALVEAQVAARADAERAAASRARRRPPPTAPFRGVPRENWWVTQHRNGWNPTPYPVWVQVTWWVFVAWVVVFTLAEHFWS